MGVFFSHNSLSMWAQLQSGRFCMYGILYYMTLNKGQGQKFEDEYLNGKLFLLSKFVAKIKNSSKVMAKFE